MKEVDKRKKVRVNMKYDAVIVGAGPIGGSVAGIISKKGFNVLILEEHNDIGRPVQCAGLVTPRVFDFVDAKKTVLNSVQGADIYSPSSHRLRIDGKKTKAVVIDRTGFDKKIVMDAVDSGSEILLGSKVIDIKRKKDIKIKFLKDGIVDEVECSLLIGADGVNSVVSKMFNFPKAKEVISGFESEMVNIDIDKKFVEIFVGKRVAPGFFSWVIPADETCMVGLCSADKPFYYFRRMFKNRVSEEVLKNAKPISYIAGSIPFGVADKTYDDNVMIAGDAACQVKPTSGGGIFTGLVGAKHCGNTAVKALEKNDFSSKMLSAYQKLWYNEIGDELKNGMRLRKIFRKLSDSDFERIFNILDDEEILALISKHGDIDYPSRISKILFKKPKLLKLVGPLIKSLF
ncbi:MAG: NAD(P)/FAD-dependent oxidoreductase [Candidatus Thermoplasmatota archaeon]|nr:NAD(P)/FAD-dependent oxidoreductase [Candidatus Thermoplasmatota archaeon]